MNVMYFMYCDVMLLIYLMYYYGIMLFMYLGLMYIYFWFKVSVWKIFYCLV